MAREKPDKTLPRKHPLLYRLHLSLQTSSSFHNERERKLTAPVKTHQSFVQWQAVKEFPRIDEGVVGHLSYY